MDNISKEELKAFTEAHEKTAAILEKIAGQLESITTTQNKLVDCLTNGMAEKIVDGVTKNYNTVHKETIDSLLNLAKAVEFNRNILTDKFPIEMSDQLNNSSIAKDISHVKWFVGIVGFIIIVATVILRGIDNNILMNKEMGIEKTIVHLLETHIKATNVQNLPEVQK